MVKVRIDTRLGAIEIAVAADCAPASAGYFLDDVRAGRRIEVIQGGLKHDSTDLPAVIPHETTAMTGLDHLKGTVSLARFAPGAVYHSFFICLRDEPSLDFGGARHPDRQGFAAFGTVTHGFKVVERIFALGEAEEYLKNEIRIERISIADA